MGNSISSLVEQELAAYERSRKSKDVDSAWRALERAHVLSQSALVPHIRVHCVMLAFAVRQRERSEVFGQILRLLLAPIGWITGRTPAGNTGRSAVSAFAEMPVPPDLRAKLHRIRR